VLAAAADEAGALEAAEAAEVAGAEIVIGTPAEAQVPSTAVMTLAWSSAEQAFCTQGVTVGIKSDFLQWQAKSVRLEQPSALKASMKHCRAQLGMSAS
jgi:hypothetical protein